MRKFFYRKMTFHWVRTSETDDYCFDDEDDQYPPGDEPYHPVPEE
jgi:hypothetical protein